MVLELDRRTFLVAAAASLAGCPDGAVDGTPTSSPPAATDTSTHGTASSTDVPPPEAYLPEPGGGWRRDGTEEYGGYHLGGTGGVRGKYTGPDGGSYEVIVMTIDLDYSPVGPANQMACAGWQVALALDRVTIAASTGTEQLTETRTHERPPTMTRSPDPDRLDRVRALLLRSPRLGESEIRERRVECKW